MLRLEFLPKASLNTLAEMVGLALFTWRDILFANAGFTDESIISYFRHEPSIDSNGNHLPWLISDHVNYLAPTPEEQNPLTNSSTPQLL